MGPRASCTLSVWCFYFYLHSACDQHQHQHVKGQQVKAHTIIPFCSSHRSPSEQPSEISLTESLCEREAAGEPLCVISFDLAEGAAMELGVEKRTRLELPLPYKMGCFRVGPPLAPSKSEDEYKYRWQLYSCSACSASVGLPRTSSTASNQQTAHSKREANRQA